MAQILSFHYSAGNSLLHRSDPRVKFLIYLGLNIALSFSSLTLRGVATLLFLLLMIMLGIPLGRFVRELRAFIWIILLSYISRAHMSGGQQISILPEVLPFPLHISWNSAGALDSLSFAIQISAALTSTHIFMYSTSLTDLQEGIFRLLRPVHRQFAWKLSTMVRIMLMAIPVLLDHASIGAAGLKMKALLPRRHPLKYLRAMGIALMRSVDHLSSAYTQSLLLRAWRPEGPEALQPLDGETGASLAIAISGVVLMAALIVLPRTLPWPIG